MFFKHGGETKGCRFVCYFFIFFTDTNVIFVLLNGESYDYIGSSRIIYDMQQGAFPNREDPNYVTSPLLKLENIGVIIELDQITNRNVFSHSRSEAQSPMVKLNLKGNFKICILCINDIIVTGKVHDGSFKR